MLCLKFKLWFLAPVPDPPPSFIFGIMYCFTTWIFVWLSTFRPLSTLTTISCIMIDRQTSSAFSKNQNKCYVLKLCNQAHAIVFLFIEVECPLKWSNHLPPPPPCWILLWGTDPGRRLPHSLPLCVRLNFGGKWVLFQSILEVDGYANMGMFLMSFSNMGIQYSVFR